MFTLCEESNEKHIKHQMRGVLTNIETSEVVELLPDNKLVDVQSKCNRVK
jgi:hypothetical protein